jgi:hypothetical protein
MGAARVCRWSSSPEGFRLRALTQRYVNLSIHSAPIDSAIPAKVMAQWANRSGFCSPRSPNWSSTNGISDVSSDICLRPACQPAKPSTVSILPPFPCSVVRTLRHLPQVMGGARSYCSAEWYGKVASQRRLWPRAHRERLPGVVHPNHRSRAAPATGASGSVAGERYREARQVPCAHPPRTSATCERIRRKPRSHLS